MTDALEAAKAAAENELSEEAVRSVGTFEYKGETYNIERKPTALMMMKVMTNKATEGEVSSNVLSFLTRTMGEAEFERFEENYNNVDFEDFDESLLGLMEVVNLIGEAASGRPGK